MRIKIIVSIACVSFCLAGIVSHAQTASPTVTNSTDSAEEQENHAREVDTVLDQSVKTSGDEEIKKLKTLLDRAMEKGATETDPEKIAESNKQKLKAVFDAWTLTRDKLQDSELAAGYWAKLIHNDPELPIRILENVKEPDKQSAMVFVSSARDFATEIYGPDAIAIALSKKVPAVREILITKSDGGGSKGAELTAWQKAATKTLILSGDTAATKFGERITSLGRTEDALKTSVLTKNGTSTVYNTLNGYIDALQKYDQVKEAVQALHVDPIPRYSPDKN
jgi:hypothetical protein